ncbi:hypothetical protein LWC33_17010 [Pseudonocardia sp. RS11V-5]|uniref:hypothetical protein n=1 Tax=Pseudonocardia terrae TaxID=2905831 RepID=UPI001E5D3BFC|nr:hypothetical protein [Pseudonocardia terrae]MCE3553151.1 hypothetical protein [Pseudonocardia terrae]
MATTSSPSTAIVVDDSGVRIAIVDDDGQVRDFAGVRIGSIRPDGSGVAVDFSGIRLGHVATS